MDKVAKIGLSIMVILVGLSWWDANHVASRIRDVTYRVYATSWRADGEIQAEVVYTNGSGGQDNRTVSKGAARINTMLLEKTVILHTGEKAFVSAQLSSTKSQDTDDITVEILVNGQREERNTSTGRFAVVDATTVVR